MVVGSSSTAGSSGASGTASSNGGSSSSGGVQCRSAAFQYAPVATEYLNAGPDTGVAQTVTVPSTMTLSSVVLPLWTCKSNGLVDAQVTITGLTAGGAPDETMVLATSGLVDSAMLRDSCVAGNVFQNATFTFANMVTLNAGGRYAIVLHAPRHAGENRTGAVSWRRSSTPMDPSNPYAGGQPYELQSGTWGASNNILDLAFDVRGAVCD